MVLVPTMYDQIWEDQHDESCFAGVSWWFELVVESWESSRAVYKGECHRFERLDIGG